MCSFACSDLAVPYLYYYCKSVDVIVNDFVEWIIGYKERVNSIESLRWLLLPTCDDEIITANYKIIFRRISETFLKSFSVNWIYSGKLRHRKTHLLFRAKMLRRVKNPELFTYIRNTKAKAM